MKRKGFLSVVLAITILATMFSTLLSVSAEAKYGTTSTKTAKQLIGTGTAAETGKYATNPGQKVGKKASITIDGDFSDWSDDMLIAQGAAWDVANHWKGGHENCVLDTYSLYAAWDNDNLYVAWQMVNTTDTWSRSGDGPLSDGGRVLDVPLILALSVDPSSTSMSNKNTDGGPIWGQQMGLSFTSHVDRLLYMSGKVGNGDPALFKAVDAEGNTNYKEGCTLFTKGDISYKMSEGCLPSSIIGLNFSDNPEDIYDENADWVDYKTFKGSQGVHDTKYDSFYEIKIPFNTLGINSSYIENNGIGAMLVATRGESALDCIPHDPSMIDNATGSYGKDPSTTHEKDDEDNITVPFARIGKMSGDTPTPTPTKVDITFDGNGGTGSMSKVTVDSNTSYTLPQCTFTAPAGKEFSYWEVTNGSQTQSYMAGTAITVSSTGAQCKAIWKDKATIPVEKVNVTFNGNGGTGSMNTVSLDPNTSYTLPQCGFTAPAGKEFSYWEVTNGGQTQNCFPGSTITVSSTGAQCKAVWVDKQQVVVGEVNGDGVIDITDATLIMKHVNHIAADLNLAAADVNGDGRIDIQDVTSLQKRIAQMM